VAGFDSTADKKAAMISFHLQFPLESYRRLTFMMLVQ
jgi:hypothetical protein